MKNWFIHIQGDTLGPLNTETVVSMLKQNRLQFVDFIWGQGLTKWVRISDLDEFTSLIPEYPKKAIPSREEDAPSIAAPVPAPQKAPVVHKEVHKEHREEKMAVVIEKKWPKFRKHARVSIAATVRVNEFGEFEGYDISEGGIFIKSTKSLPVGTEINFTLSAGDFPKALEMTGVVIRTNESDAKRGFAIEFTRVNPAHKRIIKDYVVSHAVHKK